MNNEKINKQFSPKKNTLICLVKGRMITNEHFCKHVWFFKLNLSIYHLITSKLQYIADE